MEQWVMRCLIDTNVWIDVVAGKPHAVRVIEWTTTAEWVGYSAITRLEIFSFPGLRPQDEIGFQRVLEEFNEVEISGAVIR